MAVLDVLNVVISPPGINLLDALLVVIPPLVGIFAGVQIFLRTERYRRARRRERESYPHSGTALPA
jgi:hypothetical protein